MDNKCNPVAIAILRVALTAYEDAMGPLVKALAKDKCAAQATFLVCNGAYMPHLTGGARRRIRASRCRPGYTTAALCLGTR